MNIVWSANAEKDFDALLKGNKRDALALRGKIKAFAAAPEAAGGSVKFFTETTGRVRYGDYRATFVIDDATDTLLVLRVRHRREIYR